MVGLLTVRWVNLVATGPVIAQAREATPGVASRRSSEDVPLRCTPTITGNAYAEWPLIRGRSVPVIATPAVTRTAARLQG